MKKILCIFLSVLLTACFPLSMASAAGTAPQSIRVTPEYVRLDIGGTAQLFPTVLPATADRTLHYQSENTSVATVNQSGLVTAVGEGETIISVYCLNGMRKDTVMVSVKDSDASDALSLSPWNMATNTSIYAQDGFDRNTVMNGGNYQYATAYLSRWDGPVLEEDDPYPYGLTSSTLSPMDRYIEADAAFHVQGADWLPSRTAWNDNNYIKEAIVRYGGLYASFDSANSYWNSNKSTYYLPASYSGSVSSHAVTVIGWDDNFPAENFKVKPDGNGAFICRNSYGPSSGEQGYIYISYYDKTFGIKGLLMAITDMESNENYDTQYCYDPYGAVGAWGPFNQSHIYAANIFPKKGETLSSDQLLEAVSVSTYMDNVSYELHIAPIYDGLEDFVYAKPLQTGVFTRTGYHTVRLNEPIALKAGTRFAVVFKMISPSGRGRIYVEYPYSYVDPNTGASNPLCISATAGYDEGYVSGNRITWYDVAENVANGNVCIRAFTSGGEDSLSLSSEEPVKDLVYMTESESIENQIEPHPALRQFPEEKLTLSETVTDSGMILPSRYDLRTENCLPPVRNQGTWNTCWSHTTSAQIEIFLMRARNRLDLNGENETASFHQIAQTLETADIAQTVTFEKEEITIEVGENAMLYRTVFPVTAKDTPLQFKSNNSRVTVDTYGNITGASAGTAQITCTDTAGNVYDTCIVRVVNNTAPVSLISEKEVLFMQTGDCRIAEYTILPAGTYSETVSVTSSNPNVCTTDSYGRITAISPGTATVTYQTTNGVSDTVTICVADNNSGQIYAATQQNETLMLTAENRSENTATIFVAVYADNGQLLGIAQKPIEKGFCGTTEIPLPETEEYGAIKCMMLHNFSPLATCLEMQ